MWVSVIAFIVLLIFAIYLIVAFYPILAALLVNGVILWIILTRANVEIIKEHKEKFYAFGILIACIFIIFYGFRTWHRIWWITTFLLIAFLVSQNYMLYEKNDVGKKIRQYLKGFKKTK